MNRRRGYSNNSSNNINTIINNLKDYIVPIVGILIVLVLIYSFFFRGDSPATEQNIENKVGVPITMTSGSEAQVSFKGGDKKKVLADTELYKGETLVVNKGRSNLEQSNFAFSINTRGELAYNSDLHFTVKNGDVWLDNIDPVTVDLRFASVLVKENSHITFTQNEVSSTIYLLSGSAEVTSNAGVSTVLAPQEKIEITISDASDSDLDLGLKKENLGEFFLQSDWFTINNGSSYLEEVNDDTEEDVTDDDNTLDEENNEVTPSVVQGNDYLSFGNLIDGSNVSDSSINIYGNYTNDAINKITVNNSATAVLNKQQKSFNIEGVATPNKTNDLVFKVYDASGNEISRFVYTVFYKGGTSANSTPSDSQTVVNTPDPTISNFVADPSNFTFTEPSASGTVTTSDDFVTIRGKVTAENIDKVTVNEFVLKSFNGSTWRYHASKDFKNLGEGSNVYEVKYYSGDQLIYKNFYTIIKE